MGFIYIYIIYSFYFTKKNFVCKQKIQHAVQKKNTFDFFFDSYGSVHVGRNKNGGNLFLFEIENSLISKKKMPKQLRFRKIKKKWINNECKKFFKKCQPSMFIHEFWLNLLLFNKRTNERPFILSARNKQFITTKHKMVANSMVKKSIFTIFFILSKQKKTMIMMIMTMNCFSFFKKMVKIDFCFLLVTWFDHRSREHLNNVCAFFSHLLAI